jgi:hypothetical protein
MSPRVVNKWRRDVSVIWRVTVSHVVGCGEERWSSRVHDPREYRTVG